MSSSSRVLELNRKVKGQMASMNTLHLHKENQVAYVAINRPPANALASELLQDLSSMLDTIEEQDDIRTVVLHGEGRFFSAGADIKEFTTVESEEAFAQLSAKGQKLFERIETFKKPVIAAIHGAALGGGLELALSCHLRYVTETAKLGLPELQLGLIPGYAGTQRLTRFAGAAKAAEMMFTSEPISGLDAVAWGVANKAFKEEEFMDSVKKLAEKIAKKSPIALDKTIQLINYGKHERYYEGVKKEAEYFGEIFGTEDAKEGISAFIEKRSPIFKGK